MARKLIYKGDEIKYITLEYVIRDRCRPETDFDYDAIADIVFGRLDAAIAALDERLVWRAGEGALYIEEDDSGRPIPEFVGEWWRGAVRDALAGL